MIKEVVLLGAGRVAHHLGKELKGQGIEIVQVYSRTESKAAKLATLLESTYTIELKTVVPSAALYILAISDDAIAKVAADLHRVLSPNQLIVHTSGATASTALGTHFQRFGVFYPLQSFSFEQEPDFSTIPICIFANQEDDQSTLLQLAQKLSSKTAIIDDSQRSILHVCAVFVNNFVNHLYRIGYDISKQHQVPFDFLFPLMQESLKKAQLHPPADVQTGPAIRGDHGTMAKHLALLADHPAYAAIYQLISMNIQELSDN